MGTMVLLDLMGGVALLLWGLHMVHSGILRAFGPDLRLLLAKALNNALSAVSLMGSSELLVTAVRLGAPEASVVSAFNAGAARSQNSEVKLHSARLNRSGDELACGKRTGKHRLRFNESKSLAAVFVESQFVFAVFSGEQFVEGLLEAVTPFRFRPKRFVIIDDSIEIAPFLAGIADDVAGNFSVRIDPDIHRSDHQRILRVIFHRFVLRLAEILCDFQRQDAAVVIVTQNRVVRNFDRPPG